MARLHSAARFVVVLALAASTQGLLLVQSAWLVNREWIAETLCVNPGTDCDGSCQLADRMEAMAHGGHGEHSHDAPATLLELSVSVRACAASRPAVPSPRALATRAPSTRAASDSGREASRDVFHPPRRAASA